MSIPTAALALMAEFGLTTDQIVKLSAAMDSSAAAKDVRKVQNERAYEKRKALKLLNSAGAENLLKYAEKALNHDALARVVDINPSNILTGKKDKNTRGSRLSDDWKPTEADRSFAFAEGLGPEEIEREIAQFRDYWGGVPGQRGVKLNWSATWRNRIRDITGHKRERAARLAARPYAGGNGSGASSFVDVILADRAGRRG